MSDPYQYPPVREPARRRRRGGITLLDLLMVLLTMVLAPLLALSYLSPVVNPNSGWFLAMLGLASPVLYVANIVMALYWVLRWKKYLIFPLVALLLGMGNISLFFRPELRKHYPENAPKPALTVMTYNVEGFMNFDERQRPRPSMDSIGSYVAARHPDLICFQEFQTTRKLPMSQLDELLCGLPHKEIYYVLPGREPETGWGLAIYSRHRLMNAKTIQFPETLNCAMQVDMLVRGDTVRVLNCHLQTTSLSHSDRRFITTEEFVQSNTDVKKQRVKKIVGKLRDNYRIRAVQADSIATLIAASPYPVIVCGDFNDTPLSYTYRTVKGGLKDAFVEKGLGASGTYHGFFNMFRIDYVLYNDRWHAISYDSPDLDVSDHYPVVVGLGKTEK